MRGKQNEKLRLAIIIIISFLVIATGTLFSINSFIKEDISGGVGGIIIAITILVFAGYVYIRGNIDLKKGFPLQDERSRRVVEKASSKAFYVSLYVLLIVGFLSDDIIKFKDVSQATGISVGIIALLFVIFWIIYNRKEL